jgi:hypothetical protein
MSAFRRAQHLKSHHLFAGRLRAQRTVDLAGGVGTLIKRSPQAGVGAANRSVDLVCTRSKWQLRWRPVARTRELGSRMGLAEIEPFCRNSETVLARYSRDHTNNRRLENYTFLKPNVLTWGLNVYAPPEERLLREFSNGHPKYPSAHPPCPCGQKHRGDTVSKHTRFEVCSAATC